MNTSTNITEQEWTEVEATPEMDTNVTITPEPSKEDIQRWKDIRRMVEATQLKLTIALRELDAALAPLAKISRVYADRNKSGILDIMEFGYSLTKAYEANPTIDAAIGNEYSLEISIVPVRAEGGE